ncbi:hypothetical protein ADK76_38825 [Streptomyces griseoflavus]|nr:hypothetical protein ADK76_38825 [Streptomyces griseoflavus]
MVCGIAHRLTQAVGAAVLRDRDRKNLGVRSKALDAIRISGPMPMSRNIRRHSGTVIIYGFAISGTTIDKILSRQDIPSQVWMIPLYGIIDHSDGNPLTCRLLPHLLCYE